jgi:hypothetical protein
VVFFCTRCTQCVYFISESGLLRFVIYTTTKQKEHSIVCYGVSNTCIIMIPDWEVKFCGPDRKRGQGQLYLYFAAVGKAQTPTSGTSASQTDSRPGCLAATGLFNLELDGKNFDRCLSACRTRGIQYTG